MLSGHRFHLPYRIFAIDPGTDTLGYSIIDIDFRTNTKTLIHADTFQASKWIESLQNNNQWEYQEEKYLRLERHRSHLFGMFLQYQPHLVVHESAFMGKFPKAFQGLTECLVSIRQAVMDYSPYVRIEGITPMAVKYYIGGVKKDEVKQALSTKTDLVNLPSILPYLDEHAVDSIAIGYTKANQMIDLFARSFIVY